MVKRNQHQIKINNDDYEITYQEHQGKKFMVVPVVMMVEGVHHGSMGALFHPINELGKIPGSWNGIPITVDHPQIDGEYVSANIPQVIDTTMVGRVYNTYVDGTKLKAEAWIEEDKLRQVSPILLDQINENKVIEVSVGVFTEDEETTGEWDGEEYTAIATHHRPDHLALLPGGVGACSVSDGCGIRNNINNKKGGNKLNTNEIIASMKSLKEKGFIVMETINNLSEGLVERLEILRKKINSMDTMDSFYYLQEVYDDHVIYEVNLRIGGSKLLKQSYTLNGSEVAFTGDPQEVYRKVEYVNVNEIVFKRNNNFKKKESNMETNQKCTPCIEKKVNDLIANSGHYTEDDRDWLQALEEKQLDKITANVKVVEKEVVKEVNVLTDAQKAALAYGEKQLKELREKMIKGIQDNTSKELWSDEQLNTMSDDILEKVYKSVKREEIVDFSLNSQFQMNTNKGEEIEPLYPAGIEMSKE